MVLLILAGVSISLVLGQNGLINNAKEAKNSTKDAEKNERNAFDEIADYIDDQKDEPLVSKIIDEFPGDISDNGSRSGEENNPYIINSIEDLIVFSSDVINGNNYDGKFVELGTNLDFNSNKSYAEPYRADYAKYGYNGELKTILTSGSGFLTIGEEKNIDNNNFKGTFDAKNKTIYNLKMYRENIDETLYIGLFANNQGTIKNLKLDKVNINISGIDKKYFFVGGIAGNNTGTIENCSVNGNVSIEGSFGLVAGVLGRNQGTIARCINEATVKGNGMYIAGIVAQNLSELKKSCNAGEIIGRLDRCVIQNCYTDSTIDSQENNNGNIIGYLSEQANVQSKKIFFYGDKEPIGSNTGNIAFNYEKLNQKPTQTEIIELIGGEENEFVEDTKNINGDYPILNWQ